MTLTLPPELEQQINNLEQDSLSDDPALNSEVQVLNKISAANILTLRSIQDSNKLLASLLEQQTIAAKQQREMTTTASGARPIEQRLSSCSVGDCVLKRQTFQVGEPTKTEYVDRLSRVVATGTEGFVPGPGGPPPWR